MARLTKAQRKHLQHIADNLDRGLAFLDSESVSVCRRSKQATTGLDFTRAPLTDAIREHVLGGYAGPDYALTEIAKDIGSELCCLRHARRELHALLETADGLPSR